MSVMVTVELPTKRDKLGEFLNLLKEALVTTRGFKGCQKVDTFVDEDKPSILLVELWDAPKDQEAYMAWRLETGLLETIAPFISEDPIIRSFEIREDV